MIALAALTVLFCGCGGNMQDGGKEDGNKDRELTVINYGEYFDPDALEMFTEETGIKIRYEEALTPEEMYTKYKSGAIKYDLLCSADYMLQKLIGEGELVPIDTGKMKYRDNIGAKYYEFARAFDPDNKYTIPFFWGTLGILYDTTRVSAPVDSWEVLFNGEYSGQIIMQNSMRDTFMVALKYLGYSVNTNNEEELLKAKELLIEQKPDVEAYLVDEARDETVAGNAIMSVVYSGEAYLGHEYNENLAYVVPKEGSNVWMDCFCITRNCEDVDAATQFLDFMCREDIAQMNFEYIYYSTPNEAVLSSLSEEELQNPALVPPDDVVENCEVSVQLNDETVELMSDYWKEIKAE
ncbi:MAG: ABC transporter substrate-binding protein [Lachnospiraceae bacterium]|nr:ABC transporter substrate-binding protein [Lachnospiraceae bacterium]